MTRSRDMLVAKTLSPTILFIGYGVMKFFTMGTAPIYWLDTYMTVAGGIASLVTVFAYDLTVSTTPRRPSLPRLLCIHGGFIPMLYSLYAIGYLGVYTIYYSIFVSFSVLGIIFGVICVFFGYRMAYELQALTAAPRPDPG